MCCILQVNSEEHDLKPIDLSTIPEVNKHNPEVEEAIVSDQSIAFKDITVWIDPLDATQEYTGNHICTQLHIQGTTNRYTVKQRDTCHFKDKTVLVDLLPVELLDVTQKYRYTDIYTFSVK